MPEIPISILDQNTWNILPGKIDVKAHPDITHTILILLLKRGMLCIADQIVINYIKLYKEYIRGLFKNNKKNDNNSLYNNIKLAIYEYIGHQKIVNTRPIMKHFGVNFNYTIFRCAIKADNYAIADMLIKRGYPLNIKKHNDEIYHIMNDMLNMSIMTESTFNRLIDNIILAYNNLKISLYTYIRILKKGYYKTCKKVESYVDINIWNGRELQNELIYMKNNMKHLYEYVINTFHLELDKQDKHCL
jgi:hypothetical protein